jgi:cyclopropane fatty-acyl-phospholipid synthase-like methyltransferase
MTETWSIDRINDPTFRTKFLQCPDIIAAWVGDHGGLADRDVLDFGCGEAPMALGMALRCGARRVVGAETHGVLDDALPVAKAQLGLDRLPDNLELHRINEDSPLEPLGTFDVIYSWSVFEHVRQDLIVDCYTKMKRVLRPDGVMFLQTAPLFFSAEGSHLKPWVPAPWAHLTMQQDQFFAALRQATDSPEQAAHLQWVYESLNRRTAPQLVRAAKQAGFEIIREYLTRDELPVPEELKEIYAEDALATNQLVFLARHSKGSGHR